MSRWAGVVAFAVIAGAALGACGDDDDGDEPAAAVDEASDPGGADAAGTTASDDDSDDAGDDPTADTVGTPSSSADASDGDGDGGAIDACSLLTDDEAAEALGAPVARTGPGIGVGESVCEWVSDQSWSVTVSVGGPDTAIDDTFEPLEMLSEPEPVAALPGAYYMGLGTVDFPADERHNYVQVVNGSGSDRATAERLAALLSERIAGAGS